jgi:hypothetical protein
VKFSVAMTNGRRLSVVRICGISFSSALGARHRGGGGRDALQGYLFWEKPVEWRRRGGKNYRDLLGSAGTSGSANTISLLPRPRTIAEVTSNCGSLAWATASAFLRHFRSDLLRASLYDSNSAGVPRRRNRLVGCAASRCMTFACAPPRRKTALFPDCRRRVGPRQIPFCCARTGAGESHAGARVVWPIARRRGACARDRRAIHRVRC